MTNKLDSIVDGEAGFTPAKVDDPKAAWDAHARSEPMAVDEPEPVAAAPEPERPAPADADLVALRAAGWSDDDLRGLSPEAAARHALRESGRREPVKAERAEEGDSDLEALLTEEFSAKTAKKVAPYLQKLAERQAALERGVRDNSLAGLRERYSEQYPEIKRPEVERAVLALAGPSPSREQYERSLRVLYGVRQAPAERSEARAQVAGQVTGGRRGPAPSSDPEAAKKAAWNEFVRSGDTQKAIGVRTRLGG